MQQIDEIPNPFLANLKAFEAMTPEELAEHNREVYARREELEKYDRDMKINTMIEACGLGKKFRDRTFEKFIVSPENRTVYEYFKSYAENFDQQTKGIYLRGGFGIGKTHLAAAVALYLLKRGIDVWFLSAVVLKDKIYSSYRSQTTSELLSSLTSHKLLIIDDFDKLKTKSDEWDNVKELLYDILNRLYEADKLVIFTANCTRAALATIYDGSIASRIAEMCDCLKLEGEDWRTKP